jgi:hypothetical protein
MWGGCAFATDPTVAAAWPAIFTVDTNPDAIVPWKGCGSGVGIGPPGDGTSTICVSTETTIDEPLAAGCPISASLSS